MYQSKTFVTSNQEKLPHRTSNIRYISGKKLLPAERLLVMVWKKELYPEIRKKLEGMHNGEGPTEADVDQVFYRVMEQAF